MIRAIVQNMDADEAINRLLKSGYGVTRVATTGGFFRQGNTTFMTGVADDQVEKVIAVLKDVCKQRTRLRAVSLDPVEPVAAVSGYVEVTIGGATIFVFNVEHFEQF